MNRVRQHTLEDHVNADHDAVDGVAVLDVAAASAVVHSLLQHHRHLLVRGAGVCENVPASYDIGLTNRV